MTPSLRSRTAACALLFASLATNIAYAAGVTKKKPQTSTTVSKKLSMKKSNHTSSRKKSPPRKAGPFRQSYVPVPQARPVAPTVSTPAAPPAQDNEAATTSRTAVPPPADTVPEGPATLADHGKSEIENQLVHGKSALHFAANLRQYFQALHTQLVPGSTATVRALQFGDSHTAADVMSGELRSQIQARFGNGGIGFSYAGHPFAGYRILGSGRGQSAGWQTLGTHFTQLRDAELGMGGVAIETARPGEYTQLDVTCTTMQVDYLRQPSGGSFSIRDNDLPAGHISTDSASPATAMTLDTPTATTSGPAGSATLPCTPGLNSFRFVTTGDGPIRLLGATALQPGATWEAIGINGAEAPLIRRWNATLFDSYVQRASPNLIVLAYGTNEAAARWTTEDYEVVFAQLIDKLHADAPGASILVLAPGDRSIASSHTTVTGKGKGSSRRTSRVYTPYLGTGNILVAQRDVCRTHGCAFWDWSARQGGFGSMQRWVAAGYAQPDHTHFTGVGYRALADALYADLMSAYEAFLASNPVQ